MQDDQKARILIVEDEGIIAAHIEQTILKMEYLSSGIAANAEDALKIATSESPPDLVLMDIKLPGEIDGIEAAGILMYRYDIPVIYITSYADEEILKRAKPTGPYGYLIKPVNEKELQFAVSMALYKHKTERELRISRDNLESLVKERTSELTAANAQLRSEIRERAHAEASLKESERKYFSLFNEFHGVLNILPDCIAIISADMGLVWFNKSAGSKHSMVWDETYRGRHCHDVFHQRSRPCPNCAVEECFKTGQAFESKVTARDGRDWHLRTMPLKNDAGAVYNVVRIASDITDKRRLEEEALRAAHMASVGELAAGVAHEINNPANCIMNYAQLLLDGMAAGAKERELAGEIIKESERIADIVRSLLSFSRRHEEKKSAVSIGAILKDSLALVQSQILKDGALVDVSISSDLPLIHADQFRIEQVFLNILNNARYALRQKKDAVPSGGGQGKLSITCSALEENGRRYVRTVFLDNGVGIPPDAITKVLNPFFTTKPPGQGTGLGLSISHGIVTSHGGALSIDSKEGQYTRVTVDLPVFERPPK